MIYWFYLLPLLFITTLCDREHVSHGASSSKFRTEHDTEGKHNVHSDHEAIIGSKKDAKEFDELSPEESKKRLRIIASRMDTNGDKYVDVEELTNWIHNSLLSMDKDETNVRYLEMDANKDGFISWDEYLADTYGEIKEDDEEMDAEDRRLMEEDRHYFESADVDKDAKLSESEFDAFNNPEHYSHMHEVLTKMTMLEKDTNGDGKISLSEFLGDIGDNANSEWYSVEKNRFENEYDLDKNGFLEGDEISKWLIPDVMITARQEAEHLLSNSDADKDGRLTFEEIVNEYSLFVGSEATNYGEKLKEIDHDEL